MDKSHKTPGIDSWNIISQTINKMKSEDMGMLNDWRIEIKDPLLAKVLPKDPVKALDIIKKIKLEIIDEEVQEVLEKYKQYKFNK